MRILLVVFAVFLIYGCSGNVTSSSENISSLETTDIVPLPPPPDATTESPVKEEVAPPVDTHGGIIVYEENGHGLVAAESDIPGGEITWYAAMNACNKLVL